MHSMTGFGRGSATSEPWRAAVEISSVNRKQAEIVVQAPRELNELEARIRKTVLATVSRGRVQVSITVERTESLAAAVKVDHPLALGFEAAFSELSRILHRSVLPDASDFLRQPGIVTIGSVEMDVEAAWLAISPALTEALRQLAAMRNREGSDLKNDFLARLATLESFAEKIAGLAPSRPVRQREILMKRLRDAGLELDLADERVVRELALFADRCDVTEELTRLDSHFAKFREYLDSSEPPGRALDFLCQELFREFNTIGSKANDAAIAQLIVEAKTELEKIREQVQNVE
ncbi:MAG: YicC/YloC family endoribonuclease [Luteolibacter sp.]